uniref:Uncharacterized protein n=1 Tax=Rhizophora mucronata TaxID=61149 RepID=A0A2P2NTW8_RHIMU
MQVVFILFCRKMH